MIDSLFNTPLSKRIAVILHDLLMVGLAWQLAWWARFNFDFPFYNWQLSFLLIPVLLLVHGGLFWYFRLYRALWRFASLLDLWNIFRASIVGGLVTAILLFAFFRLEGVPRSVLLLYPVFLVFLLGGARLGYRLWKDNGLLIHSDVEKNRVLIVGAGAAGDMLVRDMQRSDHDVPVVILDDNLKLANSEIRGVKIFGQINQVQECVDQCNIDWIAIAIPSAKRQEIQSIVEYCEKTNLPIKILPGFQNMKTHQDLLSDLREVSIEDILGREPVELDWRSIKSTLENKCVLVTGGGGSIGSVLVEHISELNVSPLVIVENCEFNIYRIQQKLQEQKCRINIVYVLGDICDESRMTELFDCYRPQLVFHAAAYKHVPILQEQPHEAIKNNINGTKVILDTACRFSVDKFVLISTDKAVNPSNVLGISKRIAEQYVESVNNLSGGTKCITVRFGNVLDSAGSVVPLFRSQIEQGGPVTVTHPDITRFFMTISEASQLILQAASMGNGGEIFVLDMGDPVKISYLAEQMILLSGKRLNEDVTIKYCGLRPGEKLYEELFYSSERMVATSHQKIFLAKHPAINAKKTLNQINQYLDEYINSHASDLDESMLALLNKLDDSSHRLGSTDNVIHIG